MRGVGGVVAVMTVVLALPAGAGAVVTRSGTIEMHDGVRLAYTVRLPSETGRFPTGFTYSPYSAGGSMLDSSDSSEYLKDQLVAEGYAVLGVNLRGTGCSEGDVSLQDASVWGADGAVVVEWAARQEWSNGHVGMFGGSFNGLSQVGVAGFRPPHLDAITPGRPVTDWYRGISYPGGIYNAGWMSTYPPIQTALTTPALATGTTVDPSCPGQTPDRRPGMTVATMPQHPYMDDFWRAQPDSFADRIQVPVLGYTHWQDGMVGSRSAELYLDERFDPRTSWFVGDNGGHLSAVSAALAALQLKFLARYVKGEDNGFEATPHFILYHERSAPTPRWETTSASWPDPRWSKTVRAAALTLHGDGRMDLSPPAAGEPARSYGYPMPSTTPGTSGWTPAAAPGGALEWTTPALGRDVEFFGPGSVDLTFASTATDTDVQVTLSEVRPDGQEMYVQRGWLRLSHRKLDPARSTPLRAEHTDLERDAEPLVPGEPVTARVELMPFDHVFRAGSAIRLTIDAPTAPTGDPAIDSFDYLRQPATNTVLSPSRLVLPQIPGARAPKPLAACDAVTSQPCRANATPVPAGTLTLQEPTRLGLPPSTACVSARRFRIHLRAPRGTAIRTITVYVNGVRKRTVKRRRATVVDLRGLPRGTVRVKLVAKTRRGRTIVDQRRYRTCTPGRR